MAAISALLMLTQVISVDIRVMVRRGGSVKTIAKQLECSRSAVNSHLGDSAAKRYGAVRAQP